MNSFLLIFSFHFKFWVIIYRENTTSKAVILILRSGLYKYLLLNGWIDKNEFCHSMLFDCTSTQIIMRLIYGLCATQSIRVITIILYLDKYRFPLYNLRVIKFSFRRVFKATFTSNQAQLHLLRSCIKCFPILTSI